MKTDNEDFKRLEGHAEPLEIEEHYAEPVADAGAAPVAKEAAPVPTHAGGGGIGWAAIGGLAAAFAVGAVYVLSSGWGRAGGSAAEPSVAMVGTDEVVALAGVPASAVTDVAVDQENPDAVYLFPLNGAEIAENAELTRIADEARNSGAHVSVVAYTDESGRADYNQRLSERRAKAVGDYLVAHGVDASHVHTKGSGPTHAFASAELDRRAEVHLL